MSRINPETLENFMNMMGDFLLLKEEEI